MKPQSDKNIYINDIIEGCKRGDLSAQKTLYETYAKQMTTLCMRYISNREQAIDIMHDSFIHIFTVIKSFEGKGSFDGWIKRIFVNQSLQFLRKKDLLRDSGDLEIAQTTVANDTASALDTISANEIMAEIAKLSHLNRTVFNLYALEGYSHKEIAKELNINVATTRSIYLRTRNILQKRLTENGIR